MTLDEINKIRASTGDQPLTNVGIPTTQSPSTKSLSDRLGIAQPKSNNAAYEASIGGIETIPTNIAKTFGNIPSNAANLIDEGLQSTAGNIGRSLEEVQNIYKEQGFKEGTKNIGAGFADVGSKIFKAPGEFLVGQNDKLDTLNKLTPIQQQALKQRDEILTKLDKAKKEGKDTTHLAQALKLNQESLGDLASQIGTPESRNQESIETMSNIAKYPIERPLDVPLAIYAGEKEGTDAISKISKPITRGADTSVSNIASKTKNAVVDKLGIDQGSYLAKIKEEWAKPTTIPKSSYNAATDIFKEAKKKGHDITETLVNNKISPADNIEGKVFNTNDTASQLRKETGQISGDLLRPSLEQASYYSPKVPLADVEKAAIKSVMRDAKIADKESVVAKIEKRFNSIGKGSLQEQYPQGFDLTNLHDQKITNASGVNWNNPDKDANFHISDAFKSELERVAPPELNVGKFNKQLTKNYQAAEYLEALHGKTAPQSLMKRLGITTGKIVGAGVGNALGGGLLGGVGGYHLGGTLVNAFENLPNPLKEAALRSLKINKPGVYQALEDYLGAEKMRQLEGLKLPAPRYTPQGGDPRAGSTPGYPNYNLPNSLDQSGSVAQPMSNISKNSNMPSTIPDKGLKVKGRNKGSANVKGLLGGAGAGAAGAYLLNELSNKNK